MLQYSETSTYFPTMNARAYVHHRNNIRNFELYVRIVGTRNRRAQKKKKNVFVLKIQNIRQIKNNIRVQYVAPYENVIRVKNWFWNSNVFFFSFFFFILNKTWSIHKTTFSRFIDKN